MEERARSGLIGWKGLSMFGSGQFAIVMGVGISLIGPHLTGKRGMTVLYMAGSREANKITEHAGKVKIKLKNDLVGLPKRLGLVKDKVLEVIEIRVDCYGRKSAIVLDNNEKRTPVFRTECDILEREPVPPIFRKVKIETSSPTLVPSASDHRGRAGRRYRPVSRS